MIFLITNPLNYFLSLYDNKSKGFVMSSGISERVWKAREESLYRLLSNTNYTYNQLEKNYPREFSALKHFGYAIEEARIKAAEFPEQKIEFGMVGDSKPFKVVTSRIKKVLDTRSTVLITGETGTGKNLVAEAIHAFGSRDTEPFVQLPLANYRNNPEIILIEMYGTKNGAFTGAIERVGKIEKANRGVIYMNQINSLGLKSQDTLLEVFDNYGLTVVGTSTPLDVDVRIIVSANEDLKKLVEKEKFREDLYHRLYEIEINVPPLRERKKDIPFLVQYFLKKYNERERKKFTLSDKQIDMLFEYDWPGNIRELENAIKRGVVLEKFEFPKYNGEVPTGKGLISLDGFIESGTSFREVIKSVEKHLVVEALERTEGNIKEASELLKLSYRSLRHLINDKYRLM